MKGSVKALVGIIVFLGFLLLFSANLFTSSSRSALVIQNETFSSGNNTFNGTLINPNGNTGFQNNGDFCTLQGSDNAIINVFQNFVNLFPLANCVVSFSLFLFSFQGISSSIGWLQIIIYACILALAYIAVKILRGGGT